jgi:hypothetical protein
MADSERFSYQGLFAKNAPVGAKTAFPRAKYDGLMGRPFVLGPVKGLLRCGRRFWNRS